MVGVRKQSAVSLVFLGCCRQLILKQAMVDDKYRDGHPRTEAAAVVAVVPLTPSSVARPILTRL